MEARITSKIESNNKAVGEAVALAKQTKEALDCLEEKVEEKDAALREALEDCEARMMRRFETTVKDMVQDQLRVAGFDPDLTAGALSTLNGKSAVNCSSYASVASKPNDPNSVIQHASQAERREERFWECRRSLRLWPLQDDSRESLERFLKDKLRMDETFVKEELGKAIIKKHRDPRSKLKDEHIVIFESKEVRDAIKANAPNLANFRETAGMRLHLPNHLQKDFKSLMSLSYDLKKKNPDLKRNVKFDEDELGLYMDLQLKRDGPWRRIMPEQARNATKTSGIRKTAGPSVMQEDELTELLGGDSQE